jgi:type IV pilus assembly protein PilM
MPFTLRSILGRRSGADVVGLDIQPGLVAAVQVRTNGAVLAERAFVRSLPADAVREGEVIDRAALTETLRELFAESGLGKRVRVGVANQRTVMRTLELPPMEDEKSLAQAVNFQAQDQVPMPLANAVLDFHSLGVVDTPDGPRERVVLVAAQRDMIESLLEAVREAGLQPEGVDLSAFALIRSLYRPGPDAAGRVLYLNVDGLTNLAIADGPVCSFTRVVGGGLEGMAAELAERRGIPVASARELIVACDLRAREEVAYESAPVSTPAPHASAEQQPVEEADAQSAAAEHEDLAPGEAQVAPEDVAEGEIGSTEDDDPVDADSVDAQPESAEEHASREAGASYSELMAAGTQEPEVQEPAAPAASDEDVRAVIENGIRELAGEVRNSLDFHRSQEPGGAVAYVALSGGALGVSGFAEALSAALDIEVRAESVPLGDSSLQGTVSAHRLAVAAGLATQEALK